MMDRRFLSVLLTSIVLALVVAIGFYRYSSQHVAAAPPVSATVDLVTAAQPLPIGSTLRLPMLKIFKVPADFFPKSGFSKVEDLVNRPVISNILPGEPILEARLGARGSGVGLSPMIPLGKRAVSVRVNDVVGVAGFVLPGMKVDVLVTGRPPGSPASLTKTVLQNVIVLSAGQSIQPEPQGQAIATPVVTLLVSPEEAEILILASSEGKIQLALRNATDATMEHTPGRELAQLYGVTIAEAPKPKANGLFERKLIAQIPAPPKIVLADELDHIVFIRGTQKTTEVIEIR
jgi:pilus assembly protein CpaB